MGLLTPSLQCCCVPSSNYDSNEDTIGSAGAYLLASFEHMNQDTRGHVILKAFHNIIMAMHNIMHMDVRKDGCTAPKECAMQDDCELYEVYTHCSERDGSLLHGHSYSAKQLQRLSGLPAASILPFTVFLHHGTYLVLCKWNSFNAHCLGLRHLPCLRA